MIKFIWKNLVLFRRRGGDVSVLMMTIMLITMTMVAISTNTLTTKNLRTALQSKDSIEAYYNAEKGIEYQLQILKSLFIRKKAKECVLKHYDAEGKPTNPDTTWHSNKEKGACWDKVEVECDGSERKIGGGYQWRIEPDGSTLPSDKKGLKEEDVKSIILRVDGWSPNTNCKPARTIKARTVRAIKMRIKFPEVVNASRQIVLLIDGSSATEQSKVFNDALRREKDISLVTGNSSFKSLINRLVLSLIDGKKNGGSDSAGEPFSVIKNDVVLVRQNGWCVGVNDFRGPYGADLSKSAVARYLNNLSANSGFKLPIMQNCASNITQCLETIKSNYSDLMLAPGQNFGVSEENTAYTSCSSGKENVTDFLKNTVLGLFYDENQVNLTGKGRTKKILVKIDTGTYQQLPIRHKPNVVSNPRDSHNPYLQPTEVSDGERIDSESSEGKQTSNLNLKELEKWRDLVATPSKNGFDEIIWVRFNLNGKKTSEALYNTIKRDPYPYTYSYHVRQVSGERKGYPNYVDYETGIADPPDKSTFMLESSTSTNKGGYLFEHKEVITHSTQAPVTFFEYIPYCEHVTFEGDTRKRYFCGDSVSSSSSAEYGDFEAMLMALRRTLFQSSQVK